MYVLISPTPFSVNTSIPGGVSILHVIFLLEIRSAPRILRYQSGGDMPFDAVLPNAGSDGRYQQLLLWLVLLPAQLPFGSHGYCQLLMSWTPDHWCRVTEVDATTTVNSSMLLYTRLRLYLAREYRDWELLHSQCRINRTIYAQALYQEAGISVKWNSSKEFACNVDGWYYNKSQQGSELETIVSNVSHA